MTKARKEHKCDACMTPIMAGTDYRFWKLKPWDAPDNEGFSAWHLHTLCDDRLVTGSDPADGAIYMPDYWDFVRYYLTPADRFLIGIDSSYYAA